MYTVRTHPHARRVTDVPAEERTAQARYQPACRCGWRGRPVATIAQAEQAFKQHRLEATAAW